MRRKIFAAAGLVFSGALVTGAYLRFAGSVVVTDDYRQVASAAVVDSVGRTQRLHRLSSSSFYGAPRVEGSIALTCRDGSLHRVGYVTPGLHTRVRVLPGSGCHRVEHVR